jgi:hypothetical protein
MVVFGFHSSGDEAEICLECSVVLALRHIVAKTGSAIKMAHLDLYEKRSATKSVADVILAIGNFTENVDLYFALCTPK